MISEVHSDPYILGAINAWGDIFTKTANSKEAQHPQEWRAYKTWRYIPDIGLLMWWEKPDEGEQMTVEDWLDRHGYEVKLRSTMGQKLRVSEVIKTLKGTPIKRYKNAVGKQVGPQLYVHRAYANEVVPHDQLKFAANVLKQIKPHFRFNSVMWNSKTGEIRFDEAPDFDTAREPHVGKYVSVLPDGTTREGQSNSIWHHKWLWVKDDYKGFDVDKSKEWSTLWLSKLPAIAKGTDASFSSQLKGVGLSEDLPMGAKSVSSGKMLTEANKDKAALDFLKKMVQSGPFRGKVFLAGGAVRDMVMNKDPKDLDVVVIDNGKEGGMNFARWLAQQMGNYKEGSNPVLFPNFGTAKVDLRGVFDGVDLEGYPVEAVFARKEVYAPGSRKPIDVSPGTIEDDAFRRDFTVNSMMMDLTTGRILDLTGQGVNDIKQGIIRTPDDPEKIFAQDALRMFRAIRFATKYNWELAPEVVHAIRANLNDLSNTSRERVRDELDKILQTSNPRRGFELLRDTGLLPHVAPELQQVVGMTQNVHHVEDVFGHTLSVLQATQPDLVTRLMALFHDIGKLVTRKETPTGVHFIGHENEGPAIAEKIMRDLKYPVELIQAVKTGVRMHMRLKQGGDDAVKLSDKTLRKFQAEVGEYLEKVLDVIHADNISHAGPSSMPNQIEAVRKRLASLGTQVKQPKLPINGEDLKAMGLKPGPIFTTIMSAVADAWFENPNITREQALSIAQQVAQK